MGKERFVLHSWSFVVGCALASALAVAAADTEPFAAQASEMLTELEAEAREVRSDAAVLQTFTRFPNLYSDKSHENKLSMIRQNVNDMADVVKKIHQNRDNADTWQAELATRLIMKMDSLSNDIEAAIQFTKENPERLFQPRYESYVADIYDHANSVVRTVDAYLDWADAKHEAAGK